MEFFGKITDVVLSRKGTSQSGNDYEIQSVVMNNGTESIVFDVFGTAEHIAKFGIMKGAEGKANIKLEANYFNGKYYQRNSMTDIRNGFKMIGVVAGHLGSITDKEAEAQAQVEAMQKVNEQVTITPEAPAVNTGDLPF